MKKKKSKIFKKLINGILSIIMAITKSLTIDLIKNIKIYYLISTNKEEKEKIKKQLDLEKKQEIQQDKIERIERLVYAVYNDPTYTKRQEGEYDLKHLKEGIKK